MAEDYPNDVAREKKRANEQRYRDSHRAELRVRAERYRRDHREEIRARSRKYYEEHREECLKRMRTYAQEHREQGCANSRKYYQDHREELLAWARDYRVEHREERIAYDKSYHQEHLEERRAKNREYSRTHRAQINARLRERVKTEGQRAAGRNKTNRRRAALAGLPHDLTELQWQCALAWFENRCAYCGATDESLAQDHVIPLSAGGGYVWANIVPACKRCNSSKHSSPLNGWVSGCGTAFVLADALANVAAYLESVNDG